MALNIEGNTQGVNHIISVEFRANIRSRRNHYDSQQ